MVDVACRSFVPRAVLFWVAGGFAPALAQPPGSGTAGVACAQDGSDYSYSEAVSGSVRTVTTNHCPNHPHYNLNPNYAVNEATTYTIPAAPMFVGSGTDSDTSSGHIDLSEKGGQVGVFFSGAMLFSPYGGVDYGQTVSFRTSAVYAEGNTFDQCSCHSSQTTIPSYHCHQPPSCLLRQLGQSDSAHSPQIGWAFDGFPLYGPRGPGGVMMQTCSQTGGTYGTDVCTDECGGYYSSDGSIDNFVYRYYIMGQYSDGTSCSLPGCPSPTEAYFPPTPMCFRGCCPSGQTCHSSIADCPKSPNDGTISVYSASVPTVNSLSVASGLPVNTGGCSCSGVSCSSCSENAWSESTCGADHAATNTCPSANTDGVASDAMALNPFASFLLLVLAPWAASWMTPIA